MYCIKCKKQVQVFQQLTCKECLVKRYKHIDVKQIIDNVRNVPKRLLRDLGVKG